MITNVGRRQSVGRLVGPSVIWVLDDECPQMGRSILDKADALWVKQMLSDLSFSFHLWSKEGMADIKTIHGHQE